MKVNRIWLWLIPLTLLWPLLQVVVFFIRFGDWPGMVSYALVFLPMSLITGTIFLVLWTRVSRPAMKIGLFLGYLFSSPIALIGSLLSGLVYHPIIGTILWGAGPLVMGMLIGLLVGFIVIQVRSIRI